MLAVNLVLLWVFSLLGSKEGRGSLPTPGQSRGGSSGPVAAERVHPWGPAVPGRARGQPRERNKTPRCRHGVEGDVGG